MSTPAPRARRRTHFWFAVYTLILFAVFGVSLATRQWSVAVTALMIAVVFALFTRWLWRKR